MSKDETYFIENLPLSNVYFFGECFFQGIHKNLQNNYPEIYNSFNIQNISCGGGTCYEFLMFLKSKPNLNEGIYFIAGSSHDRNGWNNGKTIVEIKKWFDTIFYDSILVFALTGPFNPRPEHEHINYNKYNQEKINMTNEENIFHIDLRFDANDDTITKDGIHIPNKTIITSNISNYLTNKTFRPKTFTQKIKKNIRKIEIKENYSNIYIFHGHNNSYFYLYNNNIRIKKHAILGHEKVKEGYTPYQDRMFVNRIKSPQIGFISFSELIYVDSIVVEK
jgi:hypothetical protein